MRNFSPLLAAVCLCSIASANEVSVSLRSGRSFQGVVDETTNDTHLWLRYGTNDAALRRGIRWKRIVRMTMDGKPTTVQQIRAAAPTATSPGYSESKPKQDNTSVQRQAERRKRQVSRAVVPRVAHLQIDAQLGNWDEDVENDGLIVRFYPLSRSGDLLATHGTLQVSLVATRRAKFHEAPRQANVPLMIRRWSVPVRSRDAGETIYLPFGSIHPERDLRISSNGDVHATLAAPGQGVFRARQMHLRIRPFPFAPSSSRWFGH